MKAIINFIEAIASGVKAGVQFLLDFIKDVAYVVELTAKFVAKIPDFFSFLPAELLAIIVALFAVVVIYKILGREG